MKNKIIILIICMLFITTVFTVTGLATFYNDPPNPPEITGPTSGQINTMHEYNFLVIDPNDDLLEKMEIDWGDGEIEEVCAGCTGPRWPSGSIQKVEHKWKSQGDYSISARVMDVYGKWSEWSEPLSVTMPVKKPILHLFIQRLCDHFPILSKLLNL